MCVDSWSESRPGSGRLLVVGKGAPDGGGIAAFIRTLLATPAAGGRDARFLNLAHDGTREGGKVSAGNVRRTLRDTWSVWRDSRDADVVHVHSALAPGVTLVRAGLLAAAARSRGCRVVVHAHGGRVQLWLTTPARRRVARLALAAAGCVVAVSEGGRDALLPVLGPDRVVLVDNGIDVDAFGPPGPVHSPPRVLFVGLLTPRKGVLDLVEASRLLRARGVEHELLLVGGSPDEGPEAEQQVRDALPPDVRLLGALPPEQMPAAYRDADVLCLPSWWEAMPLSVLEAMASGLPVVATAVGDVPRLVEDGVTGRVVPAQDPVALADALQDVLASPVRAARMGAAGRERAQQRFSAAAMSDALSDVYDAVREVGA